MRREAIGQIYNCVDGKDPPPRNIASEALRAYYFGVDPQTLKTWACQVSHGLCDQGFPSHQSDITRGNRGPAPAPD